MEDCKPGARATYLVAKQLEGVFRDKRKREENLNRSSLRDTKGLLFYMRLEKQVEPREDTTLLLRPSGIREDECEGTMADGVTRGRPGIQFSKE